MERELRDGCKELSVRYCFCHFFVDTSVMSLSLLKASLQTQKSFVSLCLSVSVQLDYCIFLPLVVRFRVIKNICNNTIT